MYQEIAASSAGIGFFEEMIRRLHVDLDLPDSELAKIPASGPVVVTANHPFGILEGAALVARFSKVRPDIKVLVNELLAAVPEVRDYFIPVDVFAGGNKAARSNQRGIREALEWLRQGRMLIVFPAGEVSHLDWKRFGIADPEWSSHIAKLIQRTRATAVPVHICGANSALFQVAGLVHPRFRTALLPYEYLNKKEQRVEVRVGSPVEPGRMAEASPEALTRYLRWRTDMLAKRRHQQRQSVRDAVPAAIAPRATSSLVVDEVNALPSSRRLVESGDQQVWVATATEVPNLLQEIGELREITFRAVGEGTGKSCDLDDFDRHYLHLFSWDTRRKQLVGAYRLGQTDEILRTHGPKGLYTSTLFRYGPQFLLEVHPALEMGRSFVRPEYQKSFSSLLMLWKGIGRFLVEHPRYRVLFGPVSISNDYSPASRELLVEYLKTNRLDERLSRFVRAKRPFRRLFMPQNALWSADLDEISAVIGDLEADGKGVPVLLRQYLKLGGRLLAFNVDPKFSRCLDGLIVVDLARTERPILNRYMGLEGAAAFLRAHRGLVS